MRVKALPADHWLVPYTRALVGECLFSQDKFEVAEPLIVPSAKQIEKLRGREDKYTWLTFRRAHRLYAEWGRPELAAEFAYNPVDQVEQDGEQD